MTTKHCSISMQNSLKKLSRHLFQFRQIFALVFALAFIFTSHAQLLWNPAGGTGASDGSGNWFGTNSLGSNVWWNAAGLTNQAWNDSSNAVIGAGVPGNYIITNNINTAITQPFSVLFTNAGSYTIALDSANDSGQLSITGNGGGGVASLFGGFTVSSNVNAVVNVPWRIVAGEDILVRGGGSLTFGKPGFGNFNSGIFFKGDGPAVSTVNLTNGTSGTGNSLGASTVGGVTLNITGSAALNIGARLDISRASGPVGWNGLSTTSIVNVGGVGATGAQLTANASQGNNTGNHLQISRSGGNAILNLMTNGLVGTWTSDATLPSGNLRICPDGNGPGVFNMSGGTLILGVGSSGVPGNTGPLLTYLTFFDGTAPNGTAVANFNMSGGIAGIRGMKFGNGSAYNANTTNQVNISGGTLYMDVQNMAAAAGATPKISLSGGTIGATASWSPACSLPINLTNINGNITFQAADANGNPFGIAFSGNLTGTGGLNKTGLGVLTLSGANTYTGSTVVSNGTLVIVTSGSPTNGNVIVDGSAAAAGLPTNSVSVANSGQYWAINNLTYAGGTPTADFNYGTLPPSTAVAPIQASGTVTFTVQPKIELDGTAIPVGTYPVIHYGGISGTPSATPILPVGAVGYVSNSVANSTIYVVVTSSSVVAGLTWRNGNGLWDFTSLNWQQFGSPVNFSNGKQVTFDDTASGTSPIFVTNVITALPGGSPSMAFNSSSKAYTILGSGAIAGPASVDIKATASVTLSGTNTYTGGTTVEPGAGPLNINFGGDGTGNNSAIGTGLLTLNTPLGVSPAKIDNTSGQLVTLSGNAQLWNNDFTFIGTANLNMGSGQVTLGSGSVNITVSNNTLIVNNQITDNGGVFGIQKSGLGSLTLSNANTFSGGVVASAGTLNINSDGALGSGLFTWNNGSIDNTSGNALSVGGYSGMTWQGTNTFIGTASLDLNGSGTINVFNTTLTLSNNTLTTEGQISGANNAITVNGPGAWTISGGSTSPLGVTINSGTVNLNAAFGSHALISSIVVNTNATLAVLNSTGTELTSSSSVIMSGGTFELNGDSGEILQSITFNSGIIRNSAGAAEFTSANGLSLAGTNCNFDLTNNSTLTVDAIITNTGSLLLTGNGTLTLTSNSTYTGSTVIAGGTLALADPLAIGGGSISNSTLINVRSGATLDVTGRGDQTLTLNNGQTLTGKGTINGNLIVSSGATLAPGGTVTTGTLTVNNNVTLGGTLLLNLNRTNTPNSGQLVALGTITFGGALSVTNTGPVLQVGDTFQLFPSAVTGFTGGINLATTDASGNTYTWDNEIGVNGSIKVLTVSGSINPNPGTIQFNVSGGILSLMWPTNLGWILQVQTNSLAIGLSNNWVSVPGSQSVTSTNLTINPANGSVFFRLQHP